MSALLRNLLIFAAAFVAAFFIIRIFLMPVPGPGPGPAVPAPPADIDLELSTDKTFAPADFNYKAHFVSPNVTDAQGNIIGRAARKLNGNVLEVKAEIEGDTGTATKRAWAWQQLGVAVKITAPPPPAGGGPAATSAFATVTYKIDFSSQNSATIADERRDQAEGDYTATAREGGKPATPFEAPALAAVSGSPITARVPPNRSQFSEDDRSNVVITQPRQKFEVGKTYIFIVQAKASAQLKGQGSAAALGNDNRKLVLKEIKIDW